MVVDLILDRKDNDKLIAEGITEVMWCDNSTHSIVYNPHDFYIDVLEYGKVGDEITMAMDYGTEADVKKALCNYIIEQDYNPQICDYINSRKWL